jgi:hypothetical protein
MRQPMGLTKETSLCQTHGVKTSQIRCVSPWVWQKKPSLCQTHGVKTRQIRCVSPWVWQNEHFPSDPRGYNETFWVQQPMGVTNWTRVPCLNSNCMILFDACTQVIFVVFNWWMFTQHCFWLYEIGLLLLVSLISCTSASSQMYGTNL